MYELFFQKEKKRETNQHIHDYQKFNSQNSRNKFFLIIIIIQIYGCYFINHDDGNELL